jgi:tetrahydromethanopterin S-methyltransferase subunit E
VVYCTKCGSNNVDIASACVNCGAQLYGASGERKPQLTRYDREYHYRKRGRPLVGIFIGLIMILASFGLLLSELYGIRIPWASIMLVLIGVFILAVYFHCETTGDNYLIFTCVRSKKADCF